MYDIRQKLPGWSWSSLNGFLMCPLRWSHLYLGNRKDEEPTSDIAMVGRICAEVMAMVRVKWLKDGVDVRGDKESIFYFAANSEDGLPVGNEHNVEGAVSIVLAAFEYMPNLLPPRENVSRWWVEHPMGFTKYFEHIPVDDDWVPTFDNPPPLFWKAKADFIWTDVDGVLHVEDDKAGWATADDRQLQGYAYLCSRLIELVDGDNMPTVENIELRLNYIAKRRHVSRSMTRQEVEPFGDWVHERTAEVLATTEFQARRCKACMWCGFKLECPLFHQVGTEIQTSKISALPAKIESKEQFDKALMFCDMGDDLVKRTRALLKGYVEEHGPQRVESIGREAKVSPTSTWEGPMGQILGEMVRQGIPKETIFANMPAYKKQIEKVVDKITPLGGKGITKDVKAENRARRTQMMGALIALGEEKPRAPKFSIVNIE